MPAQDSYSKAVPVIREIKGRTRIAEQLASIIKIHIENHDNLNLLDIGCSTGVVTSYLSCYFNQSVGIDVDEVAIKEAVKNCHQPKLKYLVMNAERTSFKSNSFNVVVLNQIYEFVENQESLVKEIFRILKPGGVCLIGARNRLALIEGQTGLPLIHFLPGNLPRMVSKKLGRKYYPAQYLTYGGLLKLFGQFEIENITPLIIKNPEKYHFPKLVKYKTLVKLFPKKVIDLLMFLVPNYFLLCRKS